MSQSDTETQQPKERSPFDYVNAVCETKDYIFTEEDESYKYPRYIINRALSFNADCLFVINEINQFPQLPNRAHYDYLHFGLDKKRRYGKWVRVEADEDLKLVMDAYGYSREKAESVIDLLSKEQLEKMRSRHGGRSK